MNEFAFSIPQDILVGRGTAERLAEAAKKTGGTHAFIISGPHLTKMGHVKHCADLLAAAGIPADIFSGTEGNPSVETVAKAVAVVAKYGGSITDYEGGGKVPGDIIPLIAIPTTAGTGSEVTAFSVITDHARNYKLTVFSYKLIPKYAILDADFLTTAPARIAAACGIDAMVHAMSHPVSAYFNVPHGVANAILLPTIMEFNALADQGKYRKIYAYIANREVPEDFEPIDLVALLRELNVVLGIPATLHDAGVTAESFAAMADDAMKSGNIAVNPRATTKADILALYQKAL